MRIMKKVTALVILLAMASSLCFAAEMFEYVPGDGSSLLTFANPSVARVEDGVLFVKNWYPVAFDISDDVIYGNLNRNIIEVEVTYVDNFGGYFWLSYVDVNGVQQQADGKIQSGKTGAAKTAKFVLYDAALRNDVMYHDGIAGDFCITYENEDGTTDGEELQITAVNAVISDKTTPIELVVKTNALGNIFFDGDEKSFSLEMRNVTGMVAKKNFKFQVLDYEKKTSYGEQIRNYVFAPDQKVTDVITVASGRYGAFWLRATMLDDNGNVGRIWDIPFSVCVKNDALSYDVGTNFLVDDADVCVDALGVVKNAGFGNLRHGYLWEEFQTGENEFAVPADSQKIIDKANSLGMDMIMVHRGHNTMLFGADYLNDPENVMYMPKTDEERAAFAEYVYQSVAVNSEKVKNIEIWNEPDLEYYKCWTTDEETGEQVCDRVNPLMYAKLMKAVYQRVKPDFPEITICGISNCEAEPWYVESWALEVFEADTDGDGTVDGYQWFDKVSLHHYSKSWDSGTDCHSTMKYIEQFKTQAETYGVDTEFYHTEFGISSTASVGYVKQSSRLSQYLLSLRAKHHGDKFFIYQFSNAGNSLMNREANFGMTEAEWSVVPFAAKPALPAISNMNNLLYGHDKVSIVTDSTYVKVYSFEDTERSRKVYSLYSKKGTRTHFFKPSESNIVFYDVNGNLLNFSKNILNSYTMSLTEQPIYAVVDSNLVAEDNVGSELFLPENEVSVVYTEGENNIVNVEATLPNTNEGDSVGVQVLDNSGKIVQMEQLFADSDGKIFFRFRKDNSKSYSLWIGTKSFEGMYVEGKDEEGGAFVFVNSSDSRYITSLDDVVANDVIRINAHVNGATYPDFSIFCATYKNDRFVGIERFDAENMSLDADVNMYYRDIDTARFGDADSIRVFLLKSDASIVPLTKKLELNK